MHQQAPRHGGVVEGALLAQHDPHAVGLAGFGKVDVLGERAREPRERVAVDGRDLSARHHVAQLEVLAAQVRLGSRPDLPQSDRMVSSASPLRAARARTSASWVSQERTPGGPGSTRDLRRYPTAPIAHTLAWLTKHIPTKQVLAVQTVYQGNVFTALVRVGELFRDAVRQSAAGVILVHNHPSGDPTPSPDDLHLTAEAVAAGRLLDVPVLDHLVIGHDAFVSLRDRGVAFERPGGGA